MTDGEQSPPRRRRRPFNTPLECGLRMLFVLDAARDRASDLQRLISYDYLLVHSGDVHGGPASLHPSVPFRGSEWLVKRELVSAGLNQMFSRELLDKTFDLAGIAYRANKLTPAFLALLKSAYAVDLRARARWLVASFGDYTDEALESYMTENVGKWGAEFDRFAATAELEL